MIECDLISSHRPQTHDPATRGRSSGGNNDDDGKQTDKVVAVAASPQLVVTRPSSHKDVDVVDEQANKAVLPASADAAGEMPPVAAAVVVPPDDYDDELRDHATDADVGSSVFISEAVSVCCLNEQFKALSSCLGNARTTTGVKMSVQVI